MFLSSTLLVRLTEVPGGQARGPERLGRQPRSRRSPHLAPAECHHEFTPRADVLRILFSALTAADFR